MKSHHYNFYFESRTLINDTGVTAGILADVLCCMINYLTVPCRIGTHVVIKTRHELQMDVETTPKSHLDLLYLSNMQFQHD
jgi:hypothetical protein